MQPIIAQDRRHPCGHDRPIRAWKESAAAGISYKIHVQRYLEGRERSDPSANEAPHPVSLSTPDSLFAPSWILGGADPPWLPRSAEAHPPGPLPPGELPQRPGNAGGHGQPAGSRLGSRRWPAGGPMCGGPAGSRLGSQTHVWGPPRGTPLIHFSNPRPVPPPPAYPHSEEEAKHPQGRGAAVIRTVSREGLVGQGV